MISRPWKFFKVQFTGDQVVIVLVLHLIGEESGANFLGQS